MATTDASAARFAAARSALAAARGAGNARETASALSAFAPFTDPRRFVAELEDGALFALLPVRLETRFVRVPAGEASRSQLWVRIYPDDCWIDTFEPLLASAELANAKLYWQRIWRAGGIEADQRAAWSGLVAAHGSGRAGYIGDTYQPVNVAAVPVKASATDVILVIPTTTTLDAAENAAVSAYWRAIWLADGDAAEVQAAAAALQTAVGGARASALVSDYQPFNLGDVPAKPLAKSDVAVSTAFVVFPPDPATKSSTWTQAPRVDIFPERFVILGFNGGALTLEAVGAVISLPLYVGPDPSVDLQANPDAAIHPQGDDLFVPDPLKWMTDFPQAVAAGMGVAIDLTAEQARTGFDRLLAIGITLGATSDEGGAALTELFRHHAQGRSGLSIVPQGAPAHNSAGVGSGHTGFDDPDQSFDDRKARPLFTPTTDPNQKRDGQWLAEVLGIDPALAATLHGADGVDQMEGRAMRRAMWPATVGYWMDKLLAPVFSDETVASTRAYFVDHVSGRGLAPAIRIGKQPYGILPTTAFSRIGWLNPDARNSDLAYLARLRGLLQRVDLDWTAMSASAAYVGKPGDAHQLLLDIVGLHPSSVEYYSRTAESLTELFNVANIWGLGPDLFSALLALALNAAARGLLQAYGYTGAQQPDILNHYFFKPAEQVTAVVDDRPLSETDPIRAYTTDGRNYVRWLIDAARTSLDALNGEAGFVGGTSPQTLLYLYLRHALLLGYYDTSYFLHKSAGFLSAADLAAMKPEPVFVHVAAAASPSESRFAALVKTEPRITGNPTLLVSDYITRNLVFLPQSAGLQDQIDALGILASAQTARLRAVLQRDDRPLQLPLRRLAARAGRLSAPRHAPRVRRARRRRQATGRRLSRRICVAGGPSPFDRRTAAGAGARRRAAEGSRPDPAGSGQRRLHPRAVDDPCADGGGAAQRLSRERDGRQSADAFGQPVLGPRAAGPVDARGRACGPVHRRPARIPLRTRAARRPRPGGSGQVHLSDAQGVSAGRRQPRRDSDSARRSHRGARGAQRHGWAQAGRSD